MQLSLHVKSTSGMCASGAQQDCLSEKNLNVANFVIKLLTVPLENQFNSLQDIWSNGLDSSFKLRDDGSNQCCVVI